MDSTRQRKLKEDNVIKPEHQHRVDHSSKHRRAPIKLRRRMLIVFGASVFLILSVGYYFDALPWSVYAHATNTLDSVALSLGMQKHAYAIIIDAGSTGSRILAFTFHRSVLDNMLKLDHELFVQVKPGLSAFADNPSQGGKQIEELLEKAKAVIPPSEWQNTPLAMKATAGLRLLPEHKAEAVLENIRKVFAASPFLTNTNSVSIMDGADEGLFSWFTVNFLLDRLGKGVARTVAALDLGGGSTQITFAPSEEETLKKSDAKYLHEISAFHQSFSIYTHSYLGLGLMAARKEILSVGNPKESTVLRSECINPIVKKDWAYGGVTYTVQGPEKPSYKIIKGVGTNPSEQNPIVDFEKCMKIVKEYVYHKVDKPAELRNREINAFSYYFDRATEYGLIDPFTGGVITVRDLHDAARSTCGIANVDQPFMCFDLTFITVLLQDGFGLSYETPLNLYKKIDGHEISWALGAAFHVLQNGL